MGKKHQHTAQWHMKQALKCLAEISVLPGDQGQRFLILRTKAEKHVKRAKELNPDATVHVKRKMETGAKAEQMVEKLKNSSSPSGGLGVSVSLPKPSVEGDEKLGGHGKD